MKALLADNRLELTVRFVLGGIFIFASIDKIIAPAHFAKIIYGYYLFPECSINLIAIVLPYLELFSGIALVLGIYPRSAVIILGSLLLFFCIAISINLVRGVEFDCGCFSFDEPGYFFSAKQLLFRDILLFIFSIYLLLYPEKRKWCLRQTGSAFQNR
ncbi:MAG: DoxX family membrane protein [Deltaproteobacteria bacterium]|nr:DoxX family membrane protein [Deltaproteobacteria bacterium]